MLRSGLRFSRLARVQAFRLGLPVASVPIGNSFGFRLNSTASATHSQVSETSKSLRSKSSNGDNNQVRQKTSNKVSEFKNYLESKDLVAAASVFVGFFNEESARQFTKNDLLQRFVKDIAYTQPESVISLLDILEKIDKVEKRSSRYWSDAILQSARAGTPQVGFDLWVRFLEKHALSEKMETFQSNQGFFVAPLITYLETCSAESSALDADVARQILRTDNVPRVPVIRDILSKSGYTDSKIQELLKKSNNLRSMLVDCNGEQFLEEVKFSGDRGLLIKLKGLYEEAKASEKPLTERTYLMFMNAFTSCGRHRETFGVWNDLTSSGVTPSVELWNVLLKVTRHRESKPLELIEGLLAKMSESGVKPNSNSYAALIDVLFISKGKTQALRVFEDMNNGTIKSPVNQVVFNTTLRGLLNYGTIEEAEQLLKNEEESGLVPDLETCNLFISKYMNADKLEAVENWFVFMKEIGVKANVDSYANIIVSLYNPAKKETPSNQDISELIQEMSTRGIPVNRDTFIRLFRALSDAKSPIEGFRTIYEIMTKKNISLNDITASFIVEAEMARGNPDNALAVFDIANRKKLIRKPIYIYNQLIRGFVNQQRFDKALRIYESLKDSKTAYPSNETYLLLLSEALMARNPDIMFDLLFDMSAFKNKIEIRQFDLSNALRDVEKAGFKIPEDVKLRMRKGRSDRNSKNLIKSEESVKSE